jgi:uncharacterized glyoxalase superfamily protein PhnB
MAITPYLLYEDVSAALRFLAKAFGLRRSGAVNRDAKGRITHAVMRFGKDFVMMGWPGPKYRNPRHLGAATQSLYVNVDNVDRHCARAKKAGAVIIEEPKDTFYGARRYGAEDREGHQWYFAESIRKQRKKPRKAAR